MFPMIQEPLGKRYPLYSSSSIRRWGRSMWVSNAINSQYRTLFKSDHALSGAGVAYLKHSLNMASM